MSEENKVRKIRIESGPAGMPYFAKVFLDDKRVEASVVRLVIDPRDNNGLMTVELQFQGVEFEVDGEALVCPVS